jgi:hypothetical protein
LVAIAANMGRMRSWDLSTAGALLAVIREFSTGVVQSWEAWLSRVETATSAKQQSANRKAQDSLTVLSSAAPSLDGERAGPDGQGR